MCLATSSLFEHCCPQRPQDHCLENWSFKQLVFTYSSRSSWARSILPPKKLNIIFWFGKKVRYEKSCVCKLFFEILSWFLCFSKFRENDGSSKTCYKCSKAIAPILHVSNLNIYHKYYKSRDLFRFTISTSFSWEVDIYVPFPMEIQHNLVLELYLLLFKV